MLVQLHTDTNVVLDAELEERLAASVSEQLERFSTALTRVEVHLSDQSASRRGATDIRCVIEARPTGRGPVAVTADDATVADALDAGVAKLAASLARTLDRGDRRSRETIRGR